MAALEDLLQHHPAEIIGFAWHDIPVEEADKVIASVYHEFGLRPIWVSARGPAPRAQAVRDALAAASDEGLNPDDYRASVIAELWDADSAEGLATLDVALSVGLVNYISDIRFGRVQPKKANEAIFYHARDKQLDSFAMISEALAAPDMATFLAAQLPSHEPYRLTREALRRYRKIATSLRIDIPDGAVLHPGEHDSRVPAIRRRLAHTGDLESVPNGDDTFDKTTVVGVERFQSRHGLAVDGIVGKGTLAAMKPAAATPTW